NGKNIPFIALIRHTGILFLPERKIPAYGKSCLKSWQKQPFGIFNDFGKKSFFSLKDRLPLEMDFHFQSFSPVFFIIYSCHELCQYPSCQYEQKNHLLCAILPLVRQSLSIAGESALPPSESLRPGSDGEKAPAQPAS